MLSNFVLRHGTISCRSLQCHRKVISLTLSTTQTPKLKVALLGRPNTGKSTLFNRLTKSKMAIVSNVPGTTRDRNEGYGNIAGLDLFVIDTGGFDDRGHIHKNVQSQVEQAIRFADVILFLVDAKEGISNLDLNFTKWIRKRMTGGLAVNITSSKASQLDTKHIRLIANKTEGAHLSDRVLDTLAEALQLGLGEPVLISATHGDGMADLAQELIAIAKLKGLDIETPALESAKSNDKIKLEERTIQLAIMGKPNVGKSSFVNAVLKEERVIVGPTPGLTRDAVHIDWEFKGRNFRLVDTAGLQKISPDTGLLRSAEERRRMQAMESTGRFDKSLPGVSEMDPEEDPSQFSQQVSELALISALNALRFAQVVLLMVEGDQGKFSKVDLQIARKCLDEGRSVVVAANKCDLVLLRGVNASEYEAGVRKHCATYLRELGEVKVVACSTLKKEHVFKVLDEVIATHDAWSKRYSTGVLNKWVRDLMVAMPVPRISGRAVNLKFMTQIKSRPPTFAIFCNVKELPQSFHRFLRSRMQRDLKLEGVPVRFVVRKTQGKVTERSLLRRSSVKKQVRFNSSSLPVGKKRDRNKFLMVKNLREKRKGRRKMDKRARGKARHH